MEILSRASIQQLDKVRIVGNGVNEIIHINEAYGRAEDLGLDLVLVSSEVQPPVVRIQDFKKLEYEKKKAKKASRQLSSLKEIKFKINISDHDLATKIDKIEKFLSRGDKVKLSVSLKGREKENPERARELIDKVGTSLSSECKINKIPGPLPLVILEPVRAPKGKVKNPSSA